MPKKQLLAGKKIAVLVETEYIPDEIKKYQSPFGNLDAEVELQTYLWGDN
jgi:protease I